MNNIEITWVYEMPKEPGISCFGYHWIDEEMTEKKNKKEWKTKEKELPNKQYIEVPISKAELDYLRDDE